VRRDKRKGAAARIARRLAPKPEASILPRHLLADEHLHSAVRLATGSAAPAAAEYESALLHLKQPDAVEQSSRSTAQGDCPRDTGLHVVGWEAVALGKRRAIGSHSGNPTRFI
jgi:hypothetical protein